MSGYLSAFESVKYPSFNYEPIPDEASWVKSEAGIWLGSFKVWYKIDKKNYMVKLSHNKRKWVSAINAAWQDNHGNWLFIFENKLMYSDNGKNWNEIPTRTWQDMNGTWYKLDSNWDLWEVKQ
jgi:hypothetical protein